MASSITTSRSLQYTADLTLDSVTVADLEQVTPTQHEGVIENK